MSAYMIVAANITNREEFISGYGAVTGPLVQKFGGKYVLMGPGVKLLEDSFGAANLEDGSMVISEWPSKDAALKFWNSPEYADAKKLRKGLADVLVMLVEAPQINA